MKAYRKALIVGLIILNLFFAACEYAPVPEPQTDRPKDPISSSGQSSAEQEKFLESIDDLLSGQDNEAPAEEKEPTPVPETEPTPAPEPETESTPEPTPAPESTLAPAPKFEFDPDTVSIVHFKVHGGPITNDVSENKGAIDAFIAKAKDALSSAKQIKVPSLPKASVELQFKDKESKVLLEMTLTTDHLLIYCFEGQSEYAFKITAQTFLDLEASAPTPDRLGYRVSFPKVELSSFDTVDVDGVTRAITLSELEAVMSRMEQECTIARESPGAQAQMTTCVKFFSSKDPSEYFYIRLYGDSRGICHLQWNSPGETQYALIRYDKYQTLTDYFKTVQYPQLAEVPNWQQYS